jgi:hypothetical protein
MNILQRLFGPRRRGTAVAPRRDTHRARARWRPQVEALEERALMSANVYVVPIAVPVDATHFHSLTAAIPVAGTGGKVTIEPGASPDAGVVTVSVANLTILGDPNVPGSILPREDLVLAASNVTLYNLNLGNVVVQSGANHETVIRSQLINFTEVGAIVGSGHNVLSQNVITGSVDLQGNSPPMGNGDLVEHNTFTSSAPAILKLSNSSYTTVQDNTIFGDGNATQMGIKVDSDSNQVLIANNRIEMTGPDAIALSLGNLNGGNTVGVKVYNNILSAGSTGTGLYINLFTNNPSNFQAVIEGNDFRGNLLGVHITAGALGGVAGQIDLGGGSNLLGSSKGGNNFRGFDGNNGHFAIKVDNIAAVFVSAQQNIFTGGISPNLIVADGSNGGGGVVDTTKNLPGDYAYVQTLYNNLLGRTGTSAELAGWITVINNAGQAAAADGILRSSEALGRIVQGYYIEYLGRAAAASEVAGWVNHLQNGWSPEMVQAVFISSPEFLSHINTDYVQALYMNILHRTGSLQELVGWNSQLPNLGLAGVAYGFSNSTENRDNHVTSLIADLLHRQPKPGEVDGFVSQPVDLLTLEGQILAGSDYHANG